jgi:hypothetical protein
MINPAKKILTDISNNIRGLLKNEVYGPVFNETANEWLVSIKITPQSIGSIEICLSKPDKNKLPVFCIEIVCEGKNESIDEIMMHNIDARTKMFQYSECHIGIEISIDLNDKIEILKLNLMISMSLQKIFKIVKHINMIEYRNENELIFHTKKNKINQNETKKIAKKVKFCLIRRDRPAVLPTIKFDYRYLG